MKKKAVIVRQAKPQDGDDILRLMTELAQFEGYADQFIVTKEDLDERLFEKQDFYVLVAEVDEKVMAILVYYTLPFTYDLKPWFYIKELFVDLNYRSMGLGKQLMTGLAQEALIKGCSKIRWDVLSTNEAAKAFYQSLGAKHDENWLLFTLDDKNIANLAKGDY